MLSVAAALDGIDEGDQLSGGEAYPAQRLARAGGKGAEHTFVE